MTTTLKLITSGQTDRVADLGGEAVRTAIEKVKPESESIQNGIISRPGEFKNKVEEAVKAIILDMITPNKYANEEVKSNYGYLSGYVKPKTVEEQIALLKAHDWDREVNWTLNEMQKAMASKQPRGEGWGVIVFDESMITKHTDGLTMNYGKPMQRVAQFIKKSRGKFHDWREGKWTRQYYRRSTNLTDKMKELWIAQGSPTGILLIPFQFGINHAGKSSRRALEVMIGGEFGLGGYEVLTLVLTHPERMSHFDDLWIDCPGDEYSDNGDGVFVCAPYVKFDGGRVGVDARDVSVARDRYGSASGFSEVES